MSLDLAGIVLQISKMVLNLKKRREERTERIDTAVRLLHEQSRKLDALKKKIALSKTTWLVAEPTEMMHCTHTPLSLPPDFVILATDGSHIDVDRHHAAHCFLINTGLVMLRYGRKPDARLENSPRIYFEDDDLSMMSPDKLREVPIEGNLLGIKRSVEECSRLAEMMVEIAPDLPVLGLMDGSMIMWNLENYPDFVVEALLDKGYLLQLENIRKMATSRPISIASYISFPRSADVVNLLRVAMCPRELVDSDRCGECTTRECYHIAGVRDRDLFTRLLAPGERSAMFISTSKIQRRYSHHVVYFFYLRLNGEIARVEVPRWVAEDELKLRMVHSMMLDQCRRGDGYPVALSEAHEKAVVTGIDRDNFWLLVDAAMTGEKLPVTDSAKSVSKRTRYV